MDGGSDKGSNMAAKTGGASVNLMGSVEVEQGGVPGNDDNEAGEVKCSEPTIEGLLLEKNKASVEIQREEIRKFKDKKASPTTVTPISVFPEQVWEQILAELKDSEDILNVFRAFPYLDGQVLKNKYWWLFDQVVPHLRPWLSNEVLLSCRLVCKRWAHGVENHLENLPFRKVVDHDRLLTGQVWYPKGSKGYYDYKLRTRDNIGCGVSFSDTSQLTQFLQDVDKHPSSRNPFLGRSVKLDAAWKKDSVAYRNAAMEILRLYGHHVWFLEVTYSDKDFCQLVHDVTLLVPNLQALRLNGSSYHDNEESKRFPDEEGSVIFPRLSNLKSLDLGLLRHPNVPRAIVPSDFVNSAKLQRLCISHSFVWEYGTFFPELRELKLTKIGNPAALFGQLTSLNAPKLSNLSMYFTTLKKYAPSCVVKLSDILSWIKLFPSLQHVGVRVSEDEVQGDVQVVGPPVFDSVPFIKSLSIHWKDVYLLGPAFLRCFPSLEYAMIFDWYDWESVRFFRQEWVVSKNLYDWNIWEELPSLKEISYHSDSSRLYEGLPTYHNRATYESLKKKKQQERQERQRPLSDEELQDCIEGFESMVSVARGEEQVDFDNDDDAVSIFPEVIWEQILGELESSKDVLNVFKAFPYLEGRVLKNKFWWLFDQVVPHLRPWIKNWELLSCRLVCKKWAHGVENHLENLHKVVEHVRPIIGYVSYPEGSQAHLRYKLGALDKIGCKFSFNYSFGLHEFFRNVDTHPSARNPFLGRSLKVTSMWDNAAHLNAVMEILRECGHHLWFISLGYSGNNFCQLVLDIISLLPNLKGIELDWQPHSNEVFQEDQRALLPHLPHLESLKFYKYMPPNFMDFFVTSYSAQIKSLSINQREWRKSSLVRFPKLRELRLQQVCYDQPDDIHELLTYFGSPDLTKLCMEVEYDGSYYNLTDILSWVGVFPKLQHFGLKIYGKKDSSSAHYIEQPVLHRVPSIKSLSISWTTAYLSASEFLRWFPSLEYAKIDAHDDSYRYKRDRLNEDVYLWEVWKETPSLKEINIYQRYGLPSHYNRIRYEWLKKQREGPPRPLTDEELQECIEGFESMVSGSWGKREETLEEAWNRWELDDGGYGYDWYW